MQNKKKALAGSTFRRAEAKSQLSSISRDGELQIPLYHFKLQQNLTYKSCHWNVWLLFPVTGK